jgi:hypothetical protein
MAKSEEQTFYNKYKSTIFLSIAAAILLLVANSALWVNNQIFNSANFAGTVTSSLTSESSRQAIAQGVTDQIFTDRPIAKRVAGDFSTKIISGLLATDQFSSILNASAEKLQIYTTSGNQEDIVIDLSGVKNIVTRLVTVADSFGQEIDIEAENVPDQIVLINESDVPNFYTAGLVFIWIAPIAFIASLIMFAYPYIKKNKLNYKKILVIQSSLLAVLTSLSLLTGPMFKPPLLAQIDKPNGRVVVGNLYEAFIATFNSQLYTIILIAVAVLFLSILSIYYPQAKKAFQLKKK